MQALLADCAGLSIPTLASTFSKAQILDENSRMGRDLSFIFGVIAFFSGVYFHFRAAYGRRRLAPARP
jgi:hypothetical protein